MTTKYREIAIELTSELSLPTEPVALSFVEKAPEGIQSLDSEVPSACSLWRRAESEVFYASAEKHFNCPIGAMTMGFDMPESVQQQLGGVVEKMFGCGYLGADEPQNIPSIQKKKSGIVYGPLRDFPFDPDLVLIWCTPRQAMLFGESTGSCRWTDTAPATTFGRPACAALPKAVESSHSVLSLGCAGMRTFTEISDNRLLAVVPGPGLEDFTDSLRKTLTANASMQEFYDGHKARFLA